MDSGSDTIAATTIPRSLQEGVRAGSLIPFVGAGVSMSIRGHDGRRVFPSWTELLRRAATHLRDEGKELDAASVDECLNTSPPALLKAAELARLGLPGCAWPRFVKTALDVRRNQVDDESLALAQAIWRVGSRRIITTNYDRVLTWACPESDDCRLLDHDAPAELAELGRAPAERPTVWHLHGSIDNVGKLVITPEGYDRLYPRDNASRHEAAIVVLRNLLINANLLFVGFSFADDRFVEQLRWLVNVFENQAGNHFVLMREREANEFKPRLDGLPITAVKFSDYGQPLVDRVHEIGAHAHSRREWHGALSPSAARSQPRDSAAPGPDILDSDERRRVFRRALVTRIVDNIESSPETPIILFGPRYVGKTTLCHQISKTWRQRVGPAAVAIWIEMSDVGNHESIDSLLGALRTRIYGALSLRLRAEFPTLANESPCDTVRFQRLLAALLTHNGRLREVLVAVDDFDILLDAQPGVTHELFGLLRAWADDHQPPFSHFRLIATARYLPLRHTVLAQSPLDGLARGVEIAGLSADEIKQYATQMGVSMTRSRATRCVEDLGGMPFLVRSMLEAMRSGDELGHRDEPREGYLRALSQALDGFDDRRPNRYRRGTIRDRLRFFLSGANSLSEDDKNFLIELGILTGGEKLRLRSMLVQEIIS